MKLKTALVLLIVLGALGVGAWQLVAWRNQPMEVAFTKVLRETIVSSVATNGKVEPVDWAVARAERSGAVTKILVRRGQQVKQGDALLELDATEAQTDLAVANSRIAQIQSDMEVLSRGGRSSDLTEIASSMDRLKLDLANTQKERDSLARLQAKQAATKFEVDSVDQRIASIQLQMKALEDRKAALVGSPDLKSAQARLQDAQAAATLAQSRIRMATVTAPVPGTVYQFDIKHGAFLNAGDAVASIGRLERVNVTVFVDEPDLGRVRRGMHVTISWDALPGRQWQGTVDKTPTQIVALGSRQVGEVICLIENPSSDLLPGTNVNAEILTESVAQALTIPKEAIRREVNSAGVFVLEGNKVAWRKIAEKVNNVTRTQVEGLKDGDAVALPTEKPLKDGMEVKPLFP
jgi:HlyD family secretion protein